jgi:hypothetical protein
LSFHIILNWFCDCKLPDRDRLILSVKTDYFVEIHEKITIANKSLIIHKTYNMHFKTPSRRQYDMRMCNCHDYYKNNSPKNQYWKVQTTTLGFFIHIYENNKVNKWSVISTPICNAYTCMYHCDVYYHD